MILSFTCAFIKQFSIRNVRLLFLLRCDLQLSGEPWRFSNPSVFIRFHSEFGNAIALPCCGAASLDPFTFSVFAQIWGNLYILLFLVSRPIAIECFLWEVTA